MPTISKTGVLKLLTLAVIGWSAIATPGWTQTHQPAVDSQAVRGAEGLNADLDACRSQDEAAFHQAVEAITIATLERGLAGLDARGVVGDEWRRAGLDQIIAREVDTAIDAVKDESSWGRLIESIVNSETAKALATPVAERVFRSEAMKGAMEQLAIGVGREVGRRIELASLNAAQPAARCIEAWLGPRYGGTIAKIVAASGAREFAIDPAKAQASVTPGAVLAEGSGAVAGVVMVIVRREIALIANRIAQRLVGVALGRVVSSVVGGIGVVLIAKDVWDFRHGVMPIIAEEMKSPDTRAKVQAELARSIAEQLGEHSREIGGKTAERVVEIWHEFRRAHAKTVELSERDPGFRRLVDSISPSRVARLDEAVALVLSSEGEAGMARRLVDGSLHHAVEKLSPAGFEAARDLRSLDQGLKWAALAGDLLPRVVEDELHRRGPPESFSRAGLARLVGLGDRLAAGRIAGLERGAREALTELPDADLGRIARALTEPELGSLAAYLGALDAAHGKYLLASILARPQQMAALASPSVRAAILASRDRTAALTTMLRGEGHLDFAFVIDDLKLMHAGLIDPRLVVARHPAATGAALAGCLLLLTLIWRTLFGRRPRRHAVAAD